MDTRDLTPGDRRELRSLVKKQFAVLRNDVKRRKDELVSEIHSELLRRYRTQDDQIKQAHLAAQAARRTYFDELGKIAAGLQEMNPGLDVRVSEYGTGGIAVSDPSRSQLQKALLAAIPQQIADASTKLDQQELELLRDLTVGALSTDQAHDFLSKIPTVGELVPKARLPEAIEQ